MNAIVLAGGAGTRLRPLTEQVPKALMPVLGRPLLGLLLGRLQSHGVTRVALAMTRTASSDAVVRAFEADQTLEGCLGPDLDVIFSFEETPLGSGGAIALAANVLGKPSDPTLVCNGDLLTDIDVTTMVHAHRELAAELSIALVEVADPSRFGVVALDDGNRITRFVEKPPAHLAPSRWINAGFWLFSPSLIATLDASQFNRVEDDLFPRLATTGRAVFGYRHHGRWADIGTPEAYREAVMDALDGNWIDPSALIEAGATVEHSSVGARTRIAARATVTESVLWDGVLVAAGATVHRSVLGSGVQVPAGAILDSAVFIHSPAGANAPRDASVTAGN